MNELFLSFFQNRITEIPSIIQELELNPSSETFERLQIPVHDFPHIDIHKALIEFSINKKYNEIVDTGMRDFQGNSVVDILGIIDNDDLLTKGIRKYQNGIIIITPRVGTFVIYGEIYSKWLTLGGTDYGYPTIDETWVGDDMGSYQNFDDKSIYFRWAVGAFSILGIIMEKWATSGLTDSFLGYPITDVSTSSENGKYSHFENGSIYWSPITPPCIVRGNIRDKWALMGWENSFLGFPIADEQNSILDSRNQVSFFERGYITYNTISGSVVVTANSIIYSSGELGPSSTDGWAKFAITSDGHWGFTGHMHESGFLSHSASFGASIFIEEVNKAIAVAENGTIHGTVDFTGSRDYDWNYGGYNEDIKNNWELLLSKNITFKMAVDVTALSVIEAILSPIIIAGAIIVIALTSGGANCQWNVRTENRDGIGVGFRCEWD